MIDYTMGRRELLAFEEELDGEFLATYQQTERRGFRWAMGLGVLSAVIVCVVLALLKSGGAMGPAGRVLFAVGIVALLAGVIWLVMRGTAREQAKAQVERPLRLDDLSRAGRYRWRFDASGCELVSPDTVFRADSACYDSVEQAAAFVVVHLLPQTDFWIPNSAFASDAERAGVCLQLNSLFNRCRNPNALVPRLLQHEAVNCGRCGYSMLKAASAVCPECGTEVTYDVFVERDKAAADIQLRRATAI
ncbi:MAG TPA: hypothetical protein VEB22_02720 [Phycisphaerales bacterium]|nr:hypothetical protein [Phycisphaerales bacterium]